MNNEWVNGYAVDYNAVLYYFKELYFIIELYNLSI